MNNISNYLSDKNNSLFKRIYRGIGSGLISLILGFFQRLLIPSLALKAWGVDFYGEWLLVTALVSNLALSDIGSTIYVTNRLTQSYSIKDASAFKRIFQSSIVFFIIFPISIGLALLLFITYFPDIFFAKGFNYIEPSILRILAALLALQVCINIPYSLFEGVYRAIGKLPRGGMISNALLLIQTAGVCLALFLQKGPLTVALIQCLPIFLSCLFCINDLNHILPELDLFKNWQVDKKTLQKLVKPSIKFLLISISQAVTIQGTVIMAGIFLGSTQIVVYSTMRTLGNTIRAPLGLIKNVIWPELTRFDVLNEHSKLATFLDFLIRSFICMIVIFSIFALQFGDSIYKFWLNKPELYNEYIMSIVLLIIALQTSWSVYAALLMSTNNHSKLSYLSLFSSINVIFFAYIGASSDLKLYGMLLGICLAELIMLFAVLYISALQYRFISFKSIAINNSLLILIPFLPYIGPYTFLIALICAIFWLSEFLKFRKYKFNI